MTTLTDWAAELFRQLPAAPDDALEMSASAFPELPESLTCSDLVIRRGFHDYDTWRIDYPQWSGSAETFGCLGLAILGAMFQQLNSLTVNITNVRSEIRSLVVLGPPVDASTGLGLRAASFHYVVSEVRRHPWVLCSPAPDDLPWFKLTNSADEVVTDAHRAERDCIHGFGSWFGSARFARLLLDLSRPTNEALEVALECEAGFRGVAPASAETRLWLPGAPYWDSPG